MTCIKCQHVVSDQSVLCVPDEPLCPCPRALWKMTQNALVFGSFVKVLVLRRGTLVKDQYLSSETPLVLFFFIDFC